MLVFCAFAMEAQVTQVVGNQSGTWSGEVHLIGDVVIQCDDVLNVEAGTTVISDGYFRILVLGSLYAEGNENAMIRFTVADTTGYSDYENATAGAWRGICFSKALACRFSYCDFSYGKNAIDTDGGVMYVELTDDIEISHCKFHDNTTRRRGAALFAINSTLNIHDTEVCNSFAFGELGSYCWGVGFHFLKCDLDMHDMVFHDNNGASAYGGGMNIDSCNMELKNAVFYNNYAVDAGGLGIQRCKEYTVKVSNMLAYNNGVLHYGGGLATAQSDPELNNLTLVDNYCGGGGGAGMQMAFNACPTLNNCIIYGNHAYAMTNQDTTEYYLGSQVWIWGSDCVPTFRNGVVQYGLDTINCYPPIPDERYVDMIKANPLFVNPENHNYNLTDNSPCVNTGLADITGLFIPETDLAGGPRVFDGRIDMGCYEWNDMNVPEVNADEKPLFVYPNPLKDNAICVVNLSNRCDVTIRLISLDGKEVYRENCGTFEAGRHNIPLDGMMRNVPKGDNLYLLVIDNQYIKIIY